MELTYNKIRVKNGRLHLQFKKISDNAILAGIKIVKIDKYGTKKVVRKINCAGKKVGDYELAPTVALQGFDKPRDLQVNDFYTDWALVQFGKEVAKPMANLFIRLDGSSSVNNIGQREANLPRPANWLAGPGGIFPDVRSWNEVKKDYTFINEMEKVRAKVKGAGNLERFDYWLNQFYYLRAVGKFRCTLARFNRAMKKVRAETNINMRKELIIKTVLPIRKKQIEELKEINKYLINSISTTGGLGTIANWQQHNIPMLIKEPEKELVEILGEGEYQRIDLEHIARNIYSVTIGPEMINKDFEYYIEAFSNRGKKLLFPATAPELNRAVIVLQQGNERD